MAGSAADPDCLVWENTCRGSGCTRAGLPACSSADTCPRTGRCLLRPAPACELYFDALVPAGRCLVVTASSIFAPDSGKVGTALRCPTTTPADPGSCASLCAGESDVVVRLRRVKLNDAGSPPWSFWAYYAPEPGNVLVSTSPVTYAKYSCGFCTDDLPSTECTPSGWEGYPW